MARRHLLVEPRRVGGRPPDGPPQRLLKGEGQLPPHLAQLRAVERVSQVVAGARAGVVVHHVLELLAELLGDELGNLE
eukprot:6962129-Prymnesium_polylepis.1